jgi:hypothetical protein
MSTRARRAATASTAGTSWFRLSPLVVVLTIAGCAGPMGTMRTDPAPMPVATFDGSYRSTIRVTSANVVPLWCNTPGQEIITVTNDQFTYLVPHIDVTGSPPAMFPAVMAQDGSFKGATNDGIITGQIDGTHMEGRLDGELCTYAFTADRM